MESNNGMRCDMVILILLLPWCVAGNVVIPTEVQKAVDLKAKICSLPWRFELPKLNKTAPVLVDFRLALWSIARIVERDEVLAFRVEIGMSWKNPFLAWTPSDYGGVNTTTCQSADVWVPDIYMLENEDTNDKHSNELFEVSNPTTISSDGTVTFDNRYMFEVYCHLRLFYFPYDNQTCIVRFASSSNDLNNLLLRVQQNQPLKNAEFIDNDEWLLTGISLETTSNTHWGKKAYSEVALKLELKRSSASYTINLVIPCTMISALSLLVFLLPEESGEKIGLGITILLALTIFQQLTADSLPENGTPYISRFYLIVVMFNALSLVMTTVTVSLHHADKSAPHWITVLIINGLGRLLCMAPKRRVEPSKSKEFTTVSSEAHVVEIREMSEEKLKAVSECKDDAKSDIVKDDDENNPWLYINRVLNRFCFIAFLFGIIISFIVMFIKPNNE